MQSQLSGKARKPRAGAKRPEPRDYVGISKQYARDVVDGRIPGCRLLRLRCQQFLDELPRDDWEYRFDAALATRACKFIECLPITDGKEDRSFVLYPWQAFIVANLFGWVHADTGLRRFTQAHVWIGAGNGKSAMASAIGLYLAFGEGQRAAEVACAAYSKKQAEIVFDTAKQMMQFRPDLARFLGVEVLAHTIVQESTGSKLEPRSSEAKTLAGMRPYCVIVDELHVVDEAVYAFLTNRLAKRDQSLLLTISTAGYDLSSIGHTIFDESVKVIEGTLQSPEVLAIVYQAEREDDLLDEGEWAKAHPNLDVTVRRNIVRTKAREATNFASLRYQFITEQLNRWVNAKEAWLTSEQWDRCEDRSLSLDQFEGRECYIGVDLALRKDLCSKTYVFPEDGPDGPTFTVFQRSYLPEAQAGSNPSFQGWAHDGHLVLTPGDITDLGQFKRELLEDARRFDVREACFDIAHAGLIVQELQEAGIAVVTVPQITRGLSQPMKDAEEAILKGRLRHSGDPLFRWTVLNVVQRVSPQGNVFPEKSDPANRIDPAVALITAFSRAPSWQSNAGPMVFRLLGSA